MRGTALRVGLQLARDVSVASTVLGKALCSGLQLSRDTAASYERKDALRTPRGACAYIVLCLRCMPAGWSFACVRTYVCRVQAKSRS